MTKTRKFIWLAGVVGGTLLGIADVDAAQVQWALAGSDEWNTAQVDGDVLRFVGSGSGSSYAKTKLDFAPDTVYRVSFDLLSNMKYREWPIGSAEIKLPFITIAPWEYPTQWRGYASFFRTPSDLVAGEFEMAVGQKDHTGDAAFRNIVIEAVTPVKAVFNGVALGDREAIHGNTYYSNLERVDARFDGAHGELKDDGEMIFVHRLPNRKFTGGEWRVNGEKLQLSGSKDGVNFTPIAQLPSGGQRFALPTELLGSDTLYLKLSYLDDGKEGEKTPGAFTFSRFTATFDGEPMEAVGRTLYYVGTAKNLELLSEPNRIDFVCTADGEKAEFRLADAGDQVVELPGGKAYTFVPALYDASYGEVLPGSSEAAQLWSADAGWKVGRHRPIPESRGEALNIDLAANESESVQLVLTPEKELRNLSGTVGTLTDADGNVLPGEVELRVVEYTGIYAPTDRESAPDEWPDALAPMTQIPVLAAGVNQPLWVTVKLPADAKAGVYKGTIDLSADDYQAQVPFAVQVYDFVLPDELRCASVASFFKRYLEECHRATTLEEKQYILEKYLKLSSDYRIDPYVPSEYIKPTIDWSMNAAKPEEVAVAIDFKAWNQEIQRLIDTYHLRRFVLEIPRPEGLASVAEENLTPVQTEQMRQVMLLIQENLKAQGWLDRFYIYEWDEPHVNRFEEVKRGLSRLRGWAPEVKIMLTPFWIQRFWDPELDIWATLANHYVDWAAQPCRDKGQELWWYVCTGPRAPYPALFIDHAGADLRTWLWQAWKDRIDGVLIWSMTFWCDANTPGMPARNIYAEPMVINETGLEYGNGDGFLIYPPREAYDESITELIDVDPLPTIRLAQWRDGVEDYEYLKMLSELVAANRDGISAEDLAAAEALLAVPADVSVAQYDFNRNPEPVRKHRAEVARLIEKLQKKSK